MTHEEIREKVREGRLLDLIRERPALYLGESSLSALASYLEGFHMASSVLGETRIDQLPQDFHDWVAYRLHFRESTSGFKNMILSRTISESAALERFFELLDECRSRQARIVAVVQEASSVPQDNLALVVYTDDPGFFLARTGDPDWPHGKSQFLPNLGSLKWAVPHWKEVLKVLDSDAYDRLLIEDWTPEGRPV